MKNLPVISVKQRMLHPSRHHVTAAQTVNLERTQDGDKQAAHCQVFSHCSHSQLCTLRIQDGEKQDTGPRELRCISKE